MAKRAGGNGKATSVHQKGLYKLYKDTNRREKNKKIKLARHMKKHPQDLQSLERRAHVFAKQPILATKTEYSRNYLRGFR